MRIAVSQAELWTAVQNAIKAVPSRPLVPIQSGIRLTARAEGLTLAADSSSLTIHYEIPLAEGLPNANAQGSIVVPARYFAEIVRRLPAGQVHLELAMPAVLAIRTAASVYRLSGTDPAEYADIPLPTTAPTLRLPSSLLQRTLRQVAFAASTSESGAALTGVACQPARDGGLRFLAADGIRLASRTLSPDIAGVVPPFPPFIIPGRNAQELAKLLGEQAGPAEILIAGSRAIFRSGRLLFSSALLEGTFPSVDHLVPPSCTTEIIVDTAELIDAIERASPLANDRHVLRLRASGDGVELAARADEIGDMREALRSGEMNGSPLDISFNGKLMRDIARAVDSPFTRLSFTGPLNPIVIRPSEDTRTVYILTPIRVR